ncbi:hypothetical protein IRJ41_009176 [Triplophysa rosa]|uniref:Uncharacterized protein n=1 Tax=Triplophysa rosa TaxID=992332 RepID=A0A9W8CC92_TRIRA|nr:hypothetical protein IRJ41_009176 [Triplophysa rosa]
MLALALSSKPRSSEITHSLSLTHFRYSTTVAPAPAASRQVWNGRQGGQERKERGKERSVRKRGKGFRQLRTVCVHSGLSDLAVSHPSLTLNLETLAGGRRVEVGAVAQHSSGFQPLATGFASCSIPPPPTHTHTRNDCCNSSLGPYASAGLIGCSGGGGIAHNYEVEMALRSSGIMDESPGAGPGVDTTRALCGEDGVIQQ